MMNIYICKKKSSLLIFNMAMFISSAFLLYIYIYIYYLFLYNYVFIYLYYVCLMIFLKLGLTSQLLLHFLHCLHLSTSSYYMAFQIPICMGMDVTVDEGRF